MQKKTQYFYPVKLFSISPGPVFSPRRRLYPLDLWGIKRKPMPVANAPPIDVFPVYNEQPEPIVDDYIIDPDYPA
jgi:hypothetical protein